MGCKVESMFIKISWDPIMAEMDVYSSACNFTELTKEFLNYAKSFAKL